MFNLNSMVIEMEHQRREFLREAHNQRMARTVKGTATNAAKRKLSFSLNLFNPQPKEEEHYTGVAPHRALKSH